MTGLFRFAAYLALWIVLTEGALSALPAGIAAAAAAAAVSCRMMLGPPLRLRPLAILAFIPHFLWRSLLGGLDVARRALAPRPRLKPVFLSHPLGLPPDFRRIFLGDEVSLLPGTLAAGRIGDAIWIHCLDADLPIARDLVREEGWVISLAAPAKTGPVKAGRAPGA